MFDLGDIIHLDFTPSAGKEMQGPHYGLVVSGRALNNTGGGKVCPITTGPQGQARAGGLTVNLMGTGLQTVGVVLVHQERFCDFKARKAKKVEQAPEYILEEVKTIITAIHEL